METLPIVDEIITGSLLGDGMIWRNLDAPYQNCKFQKGQSRTDHAGKDKMSYLQWHKDKLPFKTSILPGESILNGKKYFKYTLTTEASDCFNSIEKKWYIEEDNGRLRRRKIVPNDLKLTPLAICLWYMDDGSNYAKDANITLNTQGFQYDETGFLCDLLRQFGIKASIKNESRMGRAVPKPRVYVGRKSYFDFIDLVKPCVAWDCFSYKIDTTEYKKRPQRGETHSNSKLTDEMVEKIGALLRDGVKQKDIAAQFGVSPTTITMLANGHRWGHAGLQCQTARKKTSKLKADQLLQVRSMALEGLNQKAIAEHFGVQQSTISRILRKS